MFTNNYIALRYNIFWYTTNGSTTFGGTTINGKPVTTMLNTSGQIYETAGLRFGEFGASAMGQCRAMLTSYASSNANGYPGVYFGSGTTPPTKEDYTLEAPIVSGLSVDSGSVVEKDEGAGRYSISRSYILTNTSDANITVSEIGYVASLAVGASSRYYQVLMERSLLPSPVTIQPGEAKLITYKFNFNQPS